MKYIVKNYSDRVLLARLCTCKHSQNLRLLKHTLLPTRIIFF